MRRSFIRIRFQLALAVRRHSEGRDGRHRIHHVYLTPKSGGLPYEALQRQSESHGRISRQQKKMPCAKHPQGALPFRTVLAVTALQRQDKTYRLTESAFENAPKPLALFRIVELVVQRIDVHRKLPL